MTMEEDQNEKKQWWQFWKKDDSVKPQAQQQPITVPKQTIHSKTQQSLKNISFDNEKYGRAIADALNSLVEECKNATHPGRKMQAMMSFESIKKLHELNGIPPVNSVENIIEFLKIHNSLALNVYDHIDYKIGTELLGLITEQIYNRGGGKTELEQTLKGIGVPDDEIETSAAAGLAEYLMKNMQK
jgi:hypothetical protein